MCVSDGLPKRHPKNLHSVLKSMIYVCSVGFYECKERYDGLNRNPSMLLI